MEIKVSVKFNQIKVLSVYIFRMERREEWREREREHGHAIFYGQSEIGEKHDKTEYVHRRVNQTLGSL